MKGYEFHKLKCMKWWGYLSFRSLERSKGLIDAFHGREKVEKTLSFYEVLIGKKVSLSTSRGDSI